MVMKLKVLRIRLMQHAVNGNSYRDGEGERNIYTTFKLETKISTSIFSTYPSPKLVYVHQ